MALSVLEISKIFHFTSAFKNLQKSFKRSRYKLVPSPDLWPCIIYLSKRWLQDFTFENILHLILKRDIGRFHKDRIIYP